MRTLSIDHPLYLPPIYEQSNSMLSDLLTQLVRMVLQREWNRERSFDTDHAIIGGVEGTGKTTIVKALAVAVAACSSTFFLVYVDCKSPYDRPVALKWLSLLFREVFVRQRGSNFNQVFGHRLDDLNNAVHLLKDWDLRKVVGKLPFSVGIIVDEVQSLFVPGVVDPNDVCVAAIAELEYFAKHVPGSLAILTGSSANLRSMLFESMRDPRYSRYADFNKSLCQYYHVAAIRDCAQLKSYMKCRYGREFSDEEVSEAMHFTGGIGRAVHNRVSDPAAPRFSATGFSCLRVFKY
eukprot:ANDGO_02219.mRNA.1 hypothetical protein